MIPYDMYGINLMQIEIFLRCAEYCSFTKAADSLQVTTGMVSKKMAGLENCLGIHLFSREKNRVLLTAAGQALYRDLQGISHSLLNAVESASLMQKKEEGTLVFSVLNVINTERYFVPLLNAFDSIESSATFKINIRETEEILSDLETGRADISFLPRFMEERIQKINDLDYFRAVSSPLYVGMTETNPLAQKDTLQWEDLKTFHFIVPNPNEEKDYSSFIMKQCIKHGFLPKICSFPGEAANAYLDISENTVLVIDKYYRDFKTNFAVFRELKNTESGILMCWNSSCRFMVQRFVEHARMFYREMR
jgi:hypothetical protein